MTQELTRAVRLAEEAERAATGAVGANMGRDCTIIAQCIRACIEAQQSYGQIGEGVHSACTLPREYFLNALKVKE